MGAPEKPNVRTPSAPKTCRPMLLRPMWTAMAAISRINGETAAIG